MSIFKQLLVTFGLVSLITFTFDVTAAEVPKLECSTYTTEQMSMLHLAYALGKEHDLGYSLAAIVKQEGFVGRYIVRVNEADAPWGSYGITHMNLKTAMWLEGGYYKYSKKAGREVTTTPLIWKAKALLVPLLISNDFASMQYSIQKLLSVREGRSWKGMLAKYNGAGPEARKYATKLVKHVREFMACETFYL